MTARSRALSWRERFRAEIAYVDSNWHRLLEEYPDRSLVIEGDQIVRVFDSLEELMEACAEDEKLRQSFVCSTHKLPPIPPQRPVIVPRA